MRMSEYYSKDDRRQAVITLDDTLNLYSVWFYLDRKMYRQTNYHVVVPKEEPEDLAEDWVNGIC